jgi:DNA helicase-2/ATP-dependent DNA helicase PcrA
MESLSREEAIRWPPDRPLKVVAGAGTGKTRFLVDRFVCLVKEKGIPPERILGLTFTRKAAQELEERLRAKLEMGAESVEFHVHTFDSFWLQLLLDYPAESRIEAPVHIIDDGLVRILRQRMVHEITQGCNELSLTSFHNMNLVNLHQAVSAAHRVINSAKLSLIGTEHISLVLRQLRTNAFPDDFNHDLAEETIHFITGVSQIEERLLAESGALDYGHILLRAHRLLAENAAIREHVRRRFRHLLIDEAQDTNFGQFALLKFVANERFSNLTVVGDARQSIFGFRDAIPESLQDFQATVCALGKNFRSYQAVLDLAVETLHDWKPEESHGLTAQAGESPKPSVAGFIVPSVLEENRVICDFVRKAIERGIQPGDIAVLARSRSTLARLEDRLRAESIPTISLVGGFYRRPEILDARAYLAYLLDLDDHGALARILERSVGSFSLAAISEVLTGVSRHRGSETETAAAKERLRHLLELRNEFLAKDLSFSLRWFGYLEKAGYLTWLSTWEEKERLRAQANLRKLYELTHQLTMPPVALSEHEILSYLDFAIDSGEDEVEAPCGELDGVILTTIHRAKGLEFPIVIYCGVHDKVIQRPQGFFVHLRPRYVSGDWHYEGAGLLLFEDFANKEIPNHSDERYKEDARGEEKRLDYVALTRAKKLQIVCGHESKRSGPPQVLQLLEDFAANCPGRFFFSRSPDAESLTCLLPDVSLGERHQVAASNFPRKGAGKMLGALPIIRWSFSDFEREYSKWHASAGVYGSSADKNSQQHAIHRGVIVHDAIRLSGKGRDWLSVIHDLDRTSLLSTAEISQWQRVVGEFLSKDGESFSELPFDLLMKTEDSLLWLRGTVDRLEIQHEKGRLIDFKTGLWNDEAAARAERQLNFYAMAWRKGLWPQVKELTLCVLHLDEGREIEIPQNPAFENIIRETAQRAVRTEVT